MGCTFCLVPKSKRSLFVWNSQGWGNIEKDPTQFYNILHYANIIYMYFDYSVLIIKNNSGLKIQKICRSRAEYCPISMFLIIKSIWKQAKIAVGRIIQNLHMPSISTCLSYCPFMRWSKIIPPKDLVFIPGVCECITLLCMCWASLVAQMVKCLPAMRETWVRSLGWEDPLDKDMAIHSSTLAWKIPRTEEPGRLQSTGSQRVGYD